MAIPITKPTVGGSAGTWGTQLNDALDDLAAGAVSEAELSNYATTGAVNPLRLATINGVKGARRVHDPDPSTSDPVTVAVTYSTPLAQATKSIAFTALAVGAPVIQANYDMFDWGQAEQSTPLVYGASAISAGWVYHTSPWSFQKNKAIRFYTDSQYLSLYLYYGLLGGARVWVDNKPVSAANNYILGSSVPAFTLNLSFASVKTRLIEVRTDNYFGGIQITPFATCWKPEPLPGPRVLVVGASVTQGFYATGGYGAWDMVGDLLGLPNLAIDGQGGSGYLSNGGYYGSGTDGSGPYTNAARRANHIAWNPDVLIMNEILNDLQNPADYSVATIEAAMVSHFAALRAALPNARLIQMKSLFSPYFGIAAHNYATNLANTAQINADLDAGLLAASGVEIAGDANVINWFTGTGWQGIARTVTDAVFTNGSAVITSTTAAFTQADVGRSLTFLIGVTAYPFGKIASVQSATQCTSSTTAGASSSGNTLNLTNQRGDGNSDAYIFTDGAHPNDAGHQYMAQKIAAALLPIFTKVTT